ncbi:hypothetical protein M5X17_27410 [Paenibacillus alvei]|uniref:hypothetical protein n=1 Tax=Paenibacillus alvei TaxID=44250 RepID=UPI002282C26D|nr:hypothetical protein [Paenibacillus alvei]MCY9737433.1 hypothetical protein [Paenibacillus alvei]
MVNRRIPVIFQKVQSYDDRFTKVKIILMHLADNYNGSYFSLDVVKQSLWSLANTPILGLIKDNDFSDHGSTIVKVDGKYKETYIGQAYGVIPEDNNARFEDIVGTDGKLRTYLVCDGLMWNKFDEASEILDRDSFKNQSMELAEDYDGFEDNSTGLFHFTKFKFYGACLLGDNVQPAMRHASISLEFTESAFKIEVQDKMEEFKLLYSKSNEGGEDVKEKLLKVLTEFNLTEDALVEKGFTLDQFATEDELKEKLKALNTQTVSDVLDESKVVIDNPNDNKVDDKIEDNKDDAVKGSGSDDKTDEDNDPDDKIDDNAEDTLTPDSTDTNVADGSDGAATFSKEDYESEIARLKAEYDKIKNSFDELETEVTELREFKATKLAAERAKEEEVIYQSFATQLSEDEITAVRSVAASMSLDQIKKELYALVGMKSTNFSVSKREKNQTETVKLDFGVSSDKPDIADYTYILEKHLK